MTITRGDIVGTWRLQSYAIEYDDGRAASHPYGQIADGLLVYTADGYMNASLARSDRERFDDDNIRKASADRKAAAFDGYFNYAGSFRLDGSRIVHHVLLSLNPNFVGSEQVRDVTFDGDRMVLSTTDVLPGSGARRVHRLTWRRATVGARVASADA